MLGQLLALLLVALGVVMVAQTAIHGGSGLAYGYVFGPLLVLAGGLRLYVSRRMRG